MIKSIIVKALKFLLAAILLILIIFILVVNFYPSLGAKPEGERLERIKKTPNNKDGVFTNIHPVKEDFTWGDFKKVFAKMREGNPNKRPVQPLPFIQWTKEEVQAISDSSATAVWYGHSSFYLKMNGKNMLIDPVFGSYPSPLPYLTDKRYNDTLPIAIANLPMIDIIIISHDHYDHLDYGTILELKDKTKWFVVPLGVGAHLERWGVEKAKIIELYWNESVVIDDIKLTSTPAQHFSGRGLTDKFCTLWCSWVITGQYNLFFSGDSGYFEDFKTIGKRYGPFDVCMMECGQYNELWKDIHMMPEQTAQAHVDLNGKLLIPIHWGAFTLSLHDWNDPIKRLSKACKEQNINLATPIIGEAITIGKKQDFSDWWRGLK